MKIREAVLGDHQAIAKVHVDSWRETYRGIVPQTYLNQLSYADRATLWEKIIASDNTVFVAENEAGDIIGFGNGGKERSGDYPNYQGEVYALYLLTDYQQHGIGKKIVKEIASHLKGLQLNGVLIWVLADNPSVGFYQAIGGKKVDEESVDIGGKQLIEAAYGFDQTIFKS
ncbi:hypothetical protein Pryu01_02600 [Paraliobacillus ryukyuensis]|uniref:L-amino acid N-acyltransferase YncA n=2 Tax=Paraliobacillus ryukyuensis TaxID=200904 RepID=A0A366ECG3_9BACI|nr:GNAT family N-acetyltransferase [Paraliobacillus ryukyuensis]RBO99755.1 L-amino acid N-acyltransferase YncA [Paraliobacillus ryukyuensis]